MFAHTHKPGLSVVVIDKKGKLKDVTVVMLVIDKPKKREAVIVQAKVKLE